jgi:alginate O-acetyltransferase complex protein AlgI
MISGANLSFHESIFLPVGISFYTFMAISYLFEVYKKKEQCADFLSFGTYLSLFPHLVAGPIVRYSEIDREISSRTVNTEMFSEGIWRFCFGLGKKVILANNLGAVSDKIFALPHSELSISVAWIGIVCYTLQIFFDFSGYSDMAIGLARFFGFHFPENFNQPYNSANITEFWRRWHMTLSRWFKDFLYIPLGGNRNGSLKTYRNLVVVFFLCGLWHGASWTFVIWGLYHGFLLVIERIMKHHFHFEMKGPAGVIITLFLVMIGWVFFRSPNIDSSVGYIKTLFGMTDGVIFNYFSSLYYLDFLTVSLLIAGVFFATVPSKSLQNTFDRLSYGNRVLLKGVCSISLLLLSVMILSKTEFNPFIYFQF